MEVLHRNGVQFFEPLVYCVATGTLCLLVFRGIAGLQFGAIWAFTENLPTVDYRHVAIGTVCEQRHAKHCCVHLSMAYAYQ